MWSACGTPQVGHLISGASPSVLKTYHEAFLDGPSLKGASHGEKFLDIKKRKRLAGKKRGRHSSVFGS